MSLSYVIPSQMGGQLRPLNILRDLSSVADLIELCFHNNMDSEGRGHLRDMRRSANNPKFLTWASHAVDSVSLPLSGFVWEDAGQVVGNVSLIPFNKNNQRVYLIANVATHPQYRNRGIARQLTEAAMQTARAKRASALWLHVREDNLSAIKIYNSIGFKEDARRTVWRASAAEGVPLNYVDGVTIMRRRNADWKLQSAWMERLYPRRLNWYSKLDTRNFMPGVLNSALRFLADVNMDQWSALKDDQLQAVLSMQTTYGQNNNIWLATRADVCDSTINFLLSRTRRLLNGYRTCSFEYPANENDDAILAAGFTRQRTLVWMRADGAT